MCGNYGRSLCRLIASVSVGCVAIAPCGAAGNESGAEKGKGCVLEVAVEWGGINPRYRTDAQVMLVRKGAKGPSVVARDALAKGGVYVFEGLPPGAYVVQSVERQLAWSPYVLRGEVTIPRGETDAKLKIRPREVEVQTITVKATTAAGDSVWGRLRYWRMEGNSASTELASAGVPVRVVKDEPYVFAVEPLSVKSDVVSSDRITPASVPEGVLTLKIPVKQPSIVYSWRPDEKDAAALNDRSRLMVLLHRIVPGGGRKRIRNEDVGSCKAVPPHGQKAQGMVYGLEQGEYELEARVEGDYTGSASMATVSPVRVTVKKDEPALAELVLSRRAVGRIKVSVVGPSGVPAGNSPVGLLIGGGQVWRGVTNAKGEVTTPAMVFGTYVIDTQPPGLMYRERSVRLDREEVEAVVSYARLAVVEASWAGMPEGKVIVEGSIIPGLRPSRSRRLRIREKGCEAMLLPDELPALMYVYAGVPGKKEPPLAAVKMIDEMPEEPLVLKVERALATVRVVATPYQIGRRASTSVWFLRESDSQVGAIFHLAPSRTWSSSTQPAGEKKLAITGKCRVAPGRYHVIYVDGSREDGAYVGRTVVQAGKEVVLDVSEQADQRRVPLVDLYKSVLRRIKQGNGD